MAWLLPFLGSQGCPTLREWAAECLGLYYLHGVLHGEVSPTRHARREEQR
jgi:hypothetical protein